MFLFRPVLFVVLMLISSFASATEPGISAVVTEQPLLEKMASPSLQQMPGLSLRLLQQNQPVLRSDNIDVWMQWEKKRLQLMGQLGMWRDMVTRCDEQQTLLAQINLPLADQAWLVTQRIQANIELREYDQAWRELRQSLWQVGASPEAVAVWRQQLIHVYLGLDNINDAERAMRRYREDYPADANESVDWKLLQAQLLMRIERPLEAYQFVQHMKQPAAMALALLAQMQAQLLSPAAVRDIAQKPLLKTDLKDDQRVLYLYVNYRVAVAELDLPAQINMLEQLLINPARQALTEAVTEARKEITPDHLWQVYEQYGMQLANEQQLLQGDDPAWLILAGKSAPTQAKSLAAVIAVHAQQADLQQQAILQLSAVLEEQSDGIEIMRVVFLRSNVLPVESLPLLLRYRLVDYALSRGDLQTAARLMETLQQPPQGQDAFDWNLRRARVLILSGQYGSGVAILHNLTQQTTLSEAQLDQYLQVAFDLQAVQQHVLALQAFADIEQQQMTAKNRRELAYWKAESLQKLGQYERAALLYLESAPAPDGSFDPWYHTASFQAADALAQAGLTIDARRQYLALLNITSDPARQAVIRQRLQDLRLVKKNMQ